MENVPSNNEASSGTSALSAGLGAWLPIETAPKDGETAVLGYQKIPGGLWVIAPMYWKNGEWLIVAFHTANTEYEMQPTHWMHLPDAPNVWVTCADAATISLVQNGLEALVHELFLAKQQRDKLLALVESAFKEGFCSPSTYNDTVLNDMDEEWKNSDSCAAIAKVQP